MCLLDDFGRFFVFMRRFMSEIGVRNPSYKKLKPFIRLVGNSKLIKGGMRKSCALYKGFDCVSNSSVK